MTFISETIQSAQRLLEKDRLFRIRVAVILGVLISGFYLAPRIAVGGHRYPTLLFLAYLGAVVATSKGAEGLDVVHGENILIADEPKEFSEAVQSLFFNTELRQHLITNAFQLVQEKYNWEKVLPVF